LGIPVLGISILRIAVVGHGDLRTRVSLIDRRRVSTLIRIVRSTGVAEGRRMVVRRTGLRGRSGISIVLRHATNLHLTINACRVSVLADADVRLSTGSLRYTVKGGYTIRDL
jgi:hypothetical protein